VRNNHHLNSAVGISRLWFVAVRGNHVPGQNLLEAVGVFVKSFFPVVDAILYIYMSILVPNLFLKYLRKGWFYNGSNVSHVFGTNSIGYQFSVKIDSNYPRYGPVQRSHKRLDVGRSCIQSANFVHLLRYLRIEEQNAC
jgi:hypothetical protein